MALALRSGVAADAAADGKPGVIVEELAPVSLKGASGVGLGWPCDGARLPAGVGHWFVVGQIRKAR